MPSYTRDVPTATQFQSVSQSIIKDNFNSIDDTFRVDHYGFSATPNIGQHRQVTTPDLTIHPPNGATPIIYAKNEGTTNLGLLQYSKGPNRTIEGDQVSSPLTFIQSPQTPISLTAGQRTIVFNFNGITRAFCRVYAANFASPHKYNFASVVWDGPNTNFNINLEVSTSLNLDIDASGSNLRVGNTSGGTLNNIYWTLTFLRIEV